MDIRGTDDNTGSISGAQDREDDWMAMDMGPGSDLDPGSSCRSDHIRRDPDRGISGPMGNKEKEEVALRKLRRLVARYRMKLEGERNIGSDFAKHWRDYLPEIYRKKGRKRR